jgi:anti-anti-sigma factor
MVTAKPIDGVSVQLAARMAASGTVYGANDSRVLVVGVAGANEMWFAGEPPEVDELLREIDDLGVQDVVIDLAEITFLNGIVLRAIRQIWKRMAEGGGNLAVCNVSDIGKEILRINRYDKLWEIYDSCEEAVIAMTGR